MGVSGRNGKVCVGAKTGTYGVSGRGSVDHEVRSGIVDRPASLNENRAKIAIGEIDGNAVHVSAPGGGYGVKPWPDPFGSSCVRQPGAGDDAFNNGIGRG